MALNVQLGLAVGRVPHSGGRIPTARNNAPSVPGKSQGDHRFFRHELFERKWRSSLRVPKLPDLIETARDDLPAIRRKSHSHDFSFKAGTGKRGEVGSIG